MIAKSNFLVNRQPNEHLKQLKSEQNELIRHKLTQIEAKHQLPSTFEYFLVLQNPSASENNLFILPLLLVTIQKKKVGIFFAINS